MRRNAFAVWMILAVLLVEQNALARIAVRPAPSAQSAALLPYAGSQLAISDNEARIVRVTDSQDASQASAPSSPAFNTDSTRFIVILDSIATLYNFDSSTLVAEKQGPLFERSQLQSEGIQWSAENPGSVIGLTDSDGAIRIEAYDIESRSFSLLKDFSTILAKGEARSLSKSWTDDNTYAFSYREAGAQDWRYVIVWHRATDSLYWFDMQDAASGVAGFTDAKLDRSGKSLVVNGDWTRVWSFQSQPQNESKIIEPEAKSDFQSLSYGNDLPALTTLVNSSSESLPRSNVSRDGRFSIFNSRADGSRTDVFIAALSSEVTGTVALMWANLVNCTANDNTLQKTSGSDQADDARATSVQSIKSGDAFVEFTATETDKERWCGLNNSNAVHELASDINFAIKLTGKKKVMVCEDGVVKAKTKYKSGNVFRIAIESGVVNYYKKGQLFYTSSARPVYPLLVNASLVDSMASVSKVMINGAGFGPVISVSPAKVNVDVGQSVQFTAVVTGSASGVTWSASGGTISSNGLFTAPNTEGTCTINAKSVADPNVSATALVFVKKILDVTPPVISAVTSTNVTSNGATINWTTNEPSTTQVEYGTSTSYGNLSTLNSTMVTSHSVAFGGLAAGTLYHYRVRSKDAAGNQAISSDFTFTTSGGGDTTAPVISGISSSNVTSSSVSVSWTTNEPSDTQVEYGTTTSYGSSTQLNASMTTSHSANVSGLAAGTLYHYRVRSKDAAGNQAVSGDQTFTTAGSGGGGGGGGGIVITDKNVYLEPPAPALPAAGGTFRDPVFGTTIMRVTDERDGAFNVTNYSYYPSFNKNSTRLFIIAGGEATLYQFDAANFRISNKRRLFTVAMPGGGFPGGEDAIWSGTDPDVIYCHGRLSIYAYNVVSNTYSLVRDFSGQVPGSQIMQMSKSIDDNAFGFHLKDSSNRTVGYAGWQRSQNNLYRADTSDVNEVQVDKTGQFLYVITETEGTASAIEGRVVNLSARTVTDLTDGAPDFAPGHKDVGRGFVIGGENWNNRFLYRPLATPHQFHTVISFGNDWSVGSHVSMLADDDGWMMFSTFVANNLPSNKLFRNELFQVSTDGTARVRRLAHIHSVYRDYWDMPRATLSRDGRFAAFTSNWGSSTRRDVFVVLVPPPGGTGGGGGGGGDTAAPVISGISSSNVTSSSVSVSWTTNEPSDTQVEYGTTTSYGSSTQLNASMTTSHSANVSGLAAGTLYHYRVRSKDAAGNQAVSGDQTFTTAGSGGGGGGGGGSINSVVWSSVVNCASSDGALQKTAGRDDSPDAGALSQQRLTSGSGYLEFTATETNKTRFCGLTRTPSGTDYSAIDFAIKLTNIGIAEVRENNAYKAETPYQNGDVFRVSVEGAAVKYYKNGAVFYTSARQPSYPLMADASLISLSGSIGNAKLAATTGTLATSFLPASFEITLAEMLAVKSSTNAFGAEREEFQNFVSTEATGKAGGSRSSDNQIKLSSIHAGQHQITNRILSRKASLSRTLAADLFRRKARLFDYS